MSRYWKEPLDPARHVDHMRTCHVGGIAPKPAPDRLIERWAYFVSVCSFTFQFQSLDQIGQCLAFFSQKLHPTSCRPGVTLEHYWQSWHERLPRWLFEEPKRRKVVAALRAAAEAFRGADASPRRK